ncbi:MAG TPA: capsule biosynthesis protein, partial [Prevotella sp.]|nr:capsule biosynthesis protein [Prevotella sp.]
MKKILLGLVLLLAVPLSVCAQSSMTDSQVAEYVQRESAHGSSQAQIVTHLMQSGVDISQIRRVRRIYEQKTKGKGLENTTENATAENRLRQNNGKAKLSKTKTQTEKYDKQRNAATTGRIQGTPKWQEQYDEDDQDFLQMQQEVSNIMPVDTAKLLKQLLDQQRKDKHKVFGRDIFSNKNLSFEPIMNIATPQSYRLGPGDAVNIDIYGASQRSITATVSPDGDIVIENFGPIHVGGLSVAQATARIRSQLGARYQSSRIKLSLGQTRTVTVNVMGEVVTPGTYTLSAFASVFNALYMAGGTNDLGTLRNIKIYRHNRLISVCDIYDYILNGKMTGNVRLNDGDVIIVGP